MRHVIEFGAAVGAGGIGGALVALLYLRDFPKQLATLARLERENISAHARDWENRLKTAAAALRKTR